MSQIITNYNSHVQWWPECAKRFGTIKELPVVNPSSLVKNIIGKLSGPVLDFGCGIDKIHQFDYDIPSDQYFCLDTDPEGQFDYNSLGDIPKKQKFDFVIMNQVLEHIIFENSIQLLNALSVYINVGGYLFITVPNNMHPVRFWSHVDHITNWGFEDIYSLFKNIDFEVEQLARYNKYRLTLNPIKRLITNIVCEVFRVDWCDSIMGLGKKV